MTARRRNELLALAGGHRGEVVNVELAVVAEALLSVAAHVVPSFGTRRSDSEGWRFGFHMRVATPNV